MPRIAKQTSQASAPAPAQAAAAAPAAQAPAAGGRKGKRGSGPKPRLNRAEFSYAVWVGGGRTPKTFCKTKDEVTKFLSTVDTKLLTNVTVGKIEQIKVKVSADF
jgi:ribosomal protein L25 (general stress protein Ctc)